MTNYEKRQLIAAIENLGEEKNCDNPNVQDKQLYASIVNGLVSTKGFSIKPEELKKKADDLYYGIKCKEFRY